MRKSENSIINKYGAFGRTILLIILSGCISTAAIAQNIIVEESGDDMLNLSTGSSGKIRQEKQRIENLPRIIRSQTVFSYLRNSNIYFTSHLKELASIFNEAEALTISSKKIWESHNWSFSNYL